MKRIISLILFVALTISASRSQTLKELRIVQEDRRSLTIEFTPVVHEERVAGNNGNAFTRFVFWGSQTAFDSSGRPDFFRALPVLLPSPQYTIQIQPGESQTRDSVKLLAKPTLVPLKEFGFSPQFGDVEAPETSPLSSSLAEISEVGMTGAGYVGTLRIHPVRTISRGRVRVYARLTVRIEFGASLPPGVAASSLLRGIVRTNPPVLKAGLLRKVHGDSPLAAGDWYRIEVQDDGIYKLGLSYFQQANITVGGINTFRLYGNGGRQLPEDLTIPRPDSLQEIARLVIDENNDGNFDADDYILFYGRGPNGWNYDAGHKTYHHVINPYSTKNYYFFTFSASNGRQMDSVQSVSDPAAYQAADFQAKIFREDEIYNLFGSGRQWVGKLFQGSDNTDTYVYSLPGLVSSAPISYRFTFLSRSTTIDKFNVYENGQLLVGPVQMCTTDVSALNNTGAYACTSPVVTAARNGGVPYSRSVLKVQFNTSNPDAEGWLNWLEIFYRERLEAVNDLLLFTSPDTTATISYSVGNLSSTNGVFAFDISDHSDVKRIAQTDLSTGACRFDLSQTAGSVRELAVVGPGGFRTPPAPVKTANSNLHGMQGPVDLIIISPTDFLPEANRLKSFHESHDSLHTVVADINQVYNEFSGGVPDVMAVRDFLRYAQLHWYSIPSVGDTVRPRYVLLFGSGHYDYKNIGTSLPNWIPPYETVESVIQINSYCSDDNFVLLNPNDPRTSMAIGRLPARSLDEAKVMVDKIIGYETTAPLDPWRSRITFVADDGRTSSGDDGSIYTDQSEVLATVYTPNTFEKDKIYIVEYPTVNSAAGRRKPAANTAIVDAINNGTIIINYVGHGNDQVWAHEYVFTRDASLPQLTNSERLTFLVAATCSFGEYDNPQYLCGAEEILSMEQGGAIGDVTSSRPVYSDQNAILNQLLLMYLFQRDSTGLTPRVGDAFWLVKQQMTQSGYNPVNLAKFHLMGDPALRLDLPRIQVSVDSIGGVSTANTVGIKSLAAERVAGFIRQENGSTSSAFNGLGTIQLFDAKRNVEIFDGVGDFKFTVNGSILYRGEISVTGGRYNAVIPIPKDVTFGSNSRISLYAWNNQSDAAGYTENVIVDGTDTSAAIDTTGPQIDVYLDDINFRSGDVVKPNTTIIVELSDRSGINTSTVGVGHRLTATLSNPDRVIDLGNYYHSNLDTYQSGEAKYPLEDLNEGNYTLRVKAWDTYNNSSEADIAFSVSSEEGLALINVMNYPNPFARSTTFTFQRNSIDPIDVEIKIYTIAGRLIQSIKTQSIVDRFVRIPWDGKDRDGDDLANGVYFYKLIVQSRNANITKETIGKLAILH
jgi:hypothetical protein